MEENEKSGEITVKLGEKEININGERLKSLVAMGLEYEKMKPYSDKLNFLAARENTTFEKLVDSIAKDKDSDFYNRVLEKVGGDDMLAKRLVGIIDKESLKTAGIKKVGLRDENSLKEEFLSLKGDFDGLSTFESLNGGIIGEALSENIPLYDAILRYNHRQDMKAKEELERQKINSSAALMLQNSGADMSEREINAMINGVQSK